MFNRLFWHKPFNREASVLYAIKQAGLPLNPPDDDVEIQPKNDRGPIDSWLFLSHTTADEPIIRSKILPAIERFFVNIHFMNIGMVENQGKNFSEIVNAYKKRILTSLQWSGWFFVVITESTVYSEWVRFELGWALRHHNYRRIIALVLDRGGEKAFSPVLKFVRKISATVKNVSIDNQIVRSIKQAGIQESPNKKSFY